MVMFPLKTSGVANCITRQILALNTCVANSYLKKNQNAPRPSEILEPIVVKYNIGSVEHLVGEEHIRFICATGSEGRSARSTQQSRCLCLLA